MRSVFHVVLVSICFFSVQHLQAGEASAEALVELGHYAERESGGFINLRVVDNRFQLYFLDENRALVTPDFDRAGVRFDIVGDDPEFVRLSKADEGEYLTHVRFVRRPHVMRINLVLFNREDSDRAEGSDARKETFAFMLRQD